MWFYDVKNEENPTENGEKMGTEQKLIKIIDEWRTQHPLLWCTVGIYRDKNSEKDDNHGEEYRIFGICKVMRFFSTSDSRPPLDPIIMDCNIRIPIEFIDTSMNWVLRQKLTDLEHEINFFPWDLKQPSEGYNHRPVPISDEEINKAYPKNILKIWRPE